MGNTLYYGDNLKILRDEIGAETVDLIYLDPPFNSNASYNAFLPERSGKRSAAQALAFEDTWHWDTAAVEAYNETVGRGGSVAEAMLAFHRLLPGSDMLAYLSMMAPRLVELRRVLKPTGSIYLHCDPTASHYLKVLMDAVFGPLRFRNHITWKRADSHNDARRQFGWVSDHILLYGSGGRPTFNVQHQGFTERTLRDWYLWLEFPGGDVRRMTKEERETQTVPEGARRFNTSDLRSPNPRPNLMYEYKGYKPHRNGWAVSFEKMCDLEERGLLLFPSSLEGRIMRKRYLDEQPGAVAGDVWTDISQLRGATKERLGYPTQKPEALLERIILASSNEGELVLDPFCGCGTTVAVSQRLNRRWIGIDIAYAAVALMKNRLEAFGDQAQYEIQGAPTTVEDARELAESNPYQFQWWVMDFLGGAAVEHKKGADRGVDGRLYVPDGTPSGGHIEIIVSVKAGNVTVAHIRELEHVVRQEGAQIGVLVTMQEPTRPMRAEASEVKPYIHEPSGAAYPALQILTAADLLAKKQIDRPYANSPTATFKAAPAPKRAEARRKPLPFDGD